MRIAKNGRASPRKHWNPMNHTEEEISPLKCYAHLIATSSYKLSEFEQYHFFTNTSVLYPFHNPENLRVVIARAQDPRNPKRQLYYASLVYINRDVDSQAGTTVGKAENEDGDDGDDDDDDDDEVEALIRGRAVPYHPPPLRPAGAGSQSKGWNSSAKAESQPNVHFEIEQTKEEAIVQLAKRMEEKVHKKLGFEDVHDDILSTWQFAATRGEEAEEAEEEKHDGSQETLPVTTRPIQKRKSAWFSSN